MKDKFSIEEFVEDSVPSIEDNDRDFRSISDEIDKRINGAGGGKSSLVRDRIKGKIERIRSTITLDSDKIQDEAKGFLDNESEPEGFFEEESAVSETVENNVSANSVIDENEAGETPENDLWTGSVIDRL